MPHLKLLERCELVLFEPQRAHPPAVVVAVREGLLVTILPLALHMDGDIAQLDVALAHHADGEEAGAHARGALFDGCEPPTAVVNQARLGEAYGGERLEELLDDVTPDGGDDEERDEELDEEGELRADTCRSWRQVAEPDLAHTQSYQIAPQ